MKLFYRGKDGGPESKVTGYWLIEWKKGFSIALLKFDEGSRESYHTHAFNAISWVLKGKLLEHRRYPEDKQSSREYTPSFLPFKTTRDNFHRVFGIGKTSWALTFRGPWIDTWKEYLPKTKENLTLAHGRTIV